MPDRSVTVDAELDASIRRVATVLGDRRTWIRTAVALGLRVDAHPSSAGPVADGDLLRMRRRSRLRSARPHARSLILQARRTDPTQPPAWSVLAGPGPVSGLTVDLAVLPPPEPAAAVDHGGRAHLSVRWVLRPGTPVRAPWWSDRALTAAGRMLIGIVDVTARAPRLVVAAAILRRAGERTELLVARCASGEWELPGGKVEPRESEHEALRREITEELGVQVTPGRRLGSPVDLGDGLELRCLTATIDPGQPSAQASEHAELRWVTGDGLAGLPMRPTDEAWRPDLLRLLTVNPLDESDPPDSQ